MWKPAIPKDNREMYPYTAERRDVLENTLPKHGSFVCKLELEIDNEYVEKERLLLSSENVKIDPEQTTSSVFRREVSVIKLNPNLKERRTTTSLNDLEGKIFNGLEMQTIFEISPNG